MSASVETARSGGIGFFGLLAIVFIVLKLIGVTEVAAWSWLWVLAPLWLPLAIVLGIVIVVFLFVALISLFR